MEKQPEALEVQEWESLILPEELESLRARNSLQCGELSHLKTLQPSFSTVAQRYQDSMQKPRKVLEPRASATAD